MEQNRVRFEQISAEEIIEKLTQPQDEAEEPVYTLRHRSVVGQLDLKHRTIEIAVDIQECDFLEEVDLRYCEFKQAVYFSDCRFRGRFNSGDESETRTVYHKDLNCMRSVFEGPFDLNGGVVEGSAYFSEAKFLNEGRSIVLDRVSVGGSVRFEGTLFKGETYFHALKCGDSAYFTPATSEEGPQLTVFEKETDFSYASFGRSLECHEAIFKAWANFNSLNCGDSAYFISATFESKVDFAYASLGGNFECQRAIYKARANFNSLNCGLTAVFGSATFEGEVDFRGASFGRALYCHEAIFKAWANFNSLNCGDSAHFISATFESKVDLSYTSFGKALYFHDANFERYVDLYMSNMDLLSLGYTLPFGDDSRVDLRECQFGKFGGSPTLAREMAKRQKPDEFSRDPYLQLEKYYRSVGNELEAKRIHIIGRSELRKNAWRRGGRTEWPMLTKLADVCLWLLTGYGVRTWRLLIPILFFLGVGTWVFWPSEALVPPPGAHGQANESQANVTYLASTMSGQEQSQDGLAQHLFDRASYSLDLFLPVVNLHIDENWQPNGLGRQIYAIVHSMVGWILVPLLLASLTGIIRRE